MNAALGLNRAWNRLLMLKSLVRTPLVVEAHILCDEAPEVTLADDQDMVEELPAQRADKALRERVHVRCAVRGPYDAHR